MRVQQPRLLRRVRSRGMWSAMIVLETVRFWLLMGVAATIGFGLGHGWRGYESRKEIAALAEWGRLRAVPPPAPAPEGIRTQRALNLVEPDEDGEPFDQDAPVKCSQCGHNEDRRHQDYHGNNLGCFVGIGIRVVGSSRDYSCKCRGFVR